MMQRNQHVVEIEDESLQLSAELKTWEEGLEDFKRGDYAKAMAVFEFLSESAESEEFCRKAIYALACTRLVMAQTQEEFNEALMLWDCWSQQSSMGMDNEDPRMMAPFLERITHPGMPEPNMQKESKPKKKPVYKIDLVNKDLLVYKNMLETREKEFERVKARLESKEREVRRLKQQIESLEAIHLKFQERHKEVSSP